MSPLKLVNTQKAVALNELEDAWTDFLLSRKAMLVAETTLRTYRYTAGKFVECLYKKINSLDEIRAFHVRAFLSELRERNLSDHYIHCNARAIKTFLRFLFAENYICEQVTFQMPIIAKKRLPILSPSELKQVLNSCRSLRDKAIVMLMVDTGVRRAEACALNWGDVDIKSGLVRVKRGKGGKARSVVMGIAARRVLLKYRKTVRHSEQDPLIQTRSGNRFTLNGLRSLFVRLMDKSGIHVSPHILRRTFATLSLRAGMSPLHLQGLLGHTTLEMIRRYAQMVDDDLLEAHNQYGPIDRFLQ